MDRTDEDRLRIAHPLLLEVEQLIVDAIAREQATSGMLLGAIQALLKEPGSLTARGAAVDAVERATH